MIPGVRIQATGPRVVCHIRDISDARGDYFTVEPMRFIPHSGQARHDRRSSLSNGDRPFFHDRSNAR